MNDRDADDVIREVDLYTLELRRTQGKRRLILGLGGLLTGPPLMWFGAVVGGQGGVAILALGWALIALALGIPRALHRFHDPDDESDEDDWDFSGSDDGSDGGD